MLTPIGSAARSRLSAGCGANPAPPDAGVTAGVDPADVERAAQSIDAAYLREWVARLSADELEGRGAGTQADARARALLAAELERLGFEPGAADGSWEQPFEIVGVTSEVPERWRFRASRGSLELSWREDFVGVSGAQRFD